MSWEEVKQRLAEAKTPAERRAAAAALASHIPAEEQRMHLVSMQKGGVNVVVSETCRPPWKTRGSITR